jgi:hypothetical protein
VKIALDYDQTYTLDPMFWQTFFRAAQDAGHDIRIITIRDERFDRTADIAQLEPNISVIYTRGVAKRWYCSHFTDGFMPDIWIDDKPQTIINNSETTPEDLARWRAERTDGPHIGEGQ